MQRASALRWPLQEADGEPHLNSSDRRQPDFLIIGQPKAGTTAIHELILQHHCIAPPLLKEPCFWSYHYDWGIKWYEAIFQPRLYHARSLAYESSTSYFAHPLSASRIAEHCPRMKFILILRDTATRIYSEYQQFFRSGMETRSWEKIVEQEVLRIGDCPLVLDESYNESHEQLYLLRAPALPHLRRWLKFFPLGQFLILQYHDIVVDPIGTIARLNDFLGLPPSGDGVIERVNIGHYAPMSPLVEERLRSWFAEHDYALKSLLRELYYYSDS